MSVIARRAPVFGNVELTVERQRFTLKKPFRIAGHIIPAVEVIVVSVESDGAVGYGEASGVFYRAGEDIPGLVQQIAAAGPSLRVDISRDNLRDRLPPGGARNAIDCALWDLQSQLSGEPVWRLAGLDEPRALLTTFTVGADTPEVMAQDALAYRDARAIKIKLLGDSQDAERVMAIRLARPDVWLGIDGNQGMSLGSLEALLPTLVAARVELIEQPLPIGADAALAGLRSPIPLAADESVQSLRDLPTLVGRYDVVNIKLDKCGGLTEGLEMVRVARELGLKVMVGNMLGTSLAAAPAFLVGQACDVVDLDGPVFLSADRPFTVRYDGGYVSCPEVVWGVRTGI